MHDTRGILSPRLRRAGIGLGIAMGVGATAAPTAIAGATPAAHTGAGVAHAPSAAVTTAEPPPATGRPAPSRSIVAAGSECPNPNPADARDVRTANIYNANGADVGDIVLQYSPSARCVRAVAGCVGDRSALVTAAVYKPTTGQINAQRTAVCGSKAVTSWVNDAGIQQLAMAEKWNLAGQLGYGQTGVY